MFYDPMIAKLIATAPTRPEAIDKLRLALDHYQVAGVATNRQFLSSILADADFRSTAISPQALLLKNMAMPLWLKLRTRRSVKIWPRWRSVFTAAGRPVCNMTIMIKQLMSLS